MILTMFSLLKSFVKKIVLFCLPRKLQLIIGRSLLDAVRNDNNDNSSTNGEYYLLEMLLEKDQKSKVVFDVGANVGEWASTASSFLVQDAVIYAFEPVKETFQALSRAANEIIRPINFALGKENGEAIVYTSKMYAGTNSLVFNDYVGHSDKTEKILVRSGDSFCEENNIDKINFLKIDTEGYELSVLSGFQRMMREGRIDFIQFEYGGTWIYSRSLLRDVFVLFQKNNYQIGKIHPNSVEIFNQYDPKCETFSYSNWIAIRPGMDIPVSAFKHA